MPTTIMIKYATPVKGSVLFAFGSNPSATRQKISIARWPHVSVIMYKACKVPVWKWRAIIAHDAHYLVQYLNN